MNESNITSLFLEFWNASKNPTQSDPPTHAGKQTDSEVCVHTFTELCLDIRSFCEVWRGSAKGFNTPSNTSCGWLSIDGADVCFCRAPLRNILDSASSSSFNKRLWLHALTFSSLYFCFYYSALFICVSLFLPFTLSLLFTTGQHSTLLFQQATLQLSCKHQPKNKSNIIFNNEHNTHTHGERETDHSDISANI